MQRALALSPASFLAGLVLAGLALVSIGSGAIAQTTTRVNVDSGGAQATDGSSVSSITADGRYVAFDCQADNLVPGDTNGAVDIFVKDTLTGAIQRVSVDSTGVQGNNQSLFPSISADARYVAFQSDATNLVQGDTNGLTDIFVHDSLTGQTTLVSATQNGGPSNGDSFQPAISADGRYVAFVSHATNLVPSDISTALNCFVRDMQTGITVLADVSSSGVQSNGTCYGGQIGLSADGRFVTFASSGNNLVSGDTNASPDVFVHDMQSGATTLASVGIADGYSATNPTVSADGRYVAFATDAPLDPGDHNGTSDVYVRDLVANTTVWVSLDSFGVPANGPSMRPVISGDGRHVAFETAATNLFPGDTNAVSDVVVRDLNAGTTSAASVNSAGLEGNDISRWPSISYDGRWVSFSSPATNLVSNDTNGFIDIFRIDLTCLGSISTYCEAKTNGLGCVPTIGSLGVPSQSGPDNFYVTARNVRNNKLGMMLWSLAQDSRPFFGGTLCLHSPIKRTLGQMSGGSPTGNDCTGTYAYHFTQTYMLQQLLGAETTVYAQFWTRDPGFPPPNNVGLTNGLQFTICP